MTIRSFLRIATTAGLLLFQDPANSLLAQPIQHNTWDALLKKHVAANGMVDYKGFIQDSVQLGQYLRLLSANHPKADWPKTEQMAFWINAYNAFTIKLVIDHYPVKTIKAIKRGIPYINSVWDIKFIYIQGQNYSLNNIEHDILRPKFGDARVHAAINCASISCPRLANEAYTAQRLEKQLDRATRDFINDPLRNKVRRDQASISAIFNWFGGDFKRDAGSLRAFLNKYAAEPLRENGKISFLPYNWNLNEAK
jgi:hypothetical protein